MATRSRRKPLYTKYPPLPVLTPPRPPSGELINVILEYADVQYELGGGRTVLRLSPRRMTDPVIRETLGREARRLKDVSVIWDEDAGEIVRVCDDARAGDDAHTAQEADWAPDDPSEDDRFELTEAALSYIAAYERKRRRG